MIVLKIF